MDMDGQPPQDADAGATGDDGFAPVDAPSDAGADDGFLAVDAPGAARPTAVRRVVCPDCRTLVEVTATPNEHGRVHVQCRACGRQALIPHKTVALKA